MMLLVKPSDNHIQALMSWFTNEKELADWSGPNFRFPYDFSSFSEDLKLNTFCSFALLSSDKNDVLAFGQYYQRIGRCHLARLIVNPTFRGQGIAAQLIQKIIKTGSKELNVIECSLFVFNHNKQAIKAYVKQGFSVVDYPEKLALDNCLYMVL